MSITPAHLAVVNLSEALASFDDVYSPRIVTRTNDYDVRIAHTRGEHVWHVHEDTDEFFLVLDGQFNVAYRDAAGQEHTVVLRQGDTFVVPKGTEHKPSSPGGSILMFEPTGTSTTGDRHEGAVPDHVDSTAGKALATPGRGPTPHGPDGVRYDRWVSTLMTARLLLRPYRESELPAFLLLALDPEVTHLVGDGAPWSQQRAADRFHRGRAAHEQGSGVWLQVADRHTDEQVGVVAVERRADDLEIGVWITPARWSNGYAREALSAVLGQLRITRGLAGLPIVAEIDSQHVRSSQLFQSLGFRLGGPGIGRYGNRVDRYVLDGHRLR
ncbi:GNAT family N-acetyltransferase [Micromonospora sp. NPDC049230]|uniref:GNAT family N-acetyltransferase n=1 Tax=Micromonospora sp. NPDC049230 TaxID=3155502 RepID=UPI0034007C14